MKAYYSVPGMTTIYDLSGEGPQAERLRDLIWRRAAEGARIRIVDRAIGPFCSSCGRMR